MSNPTSPDNRFLTAAALLWLAFFALLALTLPLLPVDETRYLTVAWEMRLTHHWLLPTLNGVPYSHKPPLLFWIINLFWSVGGTSVWVARIFAGLATLSVLFITRCYAKFLYPERPLIATLAPLLLVGCPAILGYGGLIMFDITLTCFAILALSCIWQAATGTEQGWKPWLLFGLFTGLGVLTKGPVIALYVGFPALLAPFIFKDRMASKGAWYGRLLVGLLIATAIGLAWAVPAAIEGGAAFAKVLFVKQSAGRMVESFAHRRPFWFYLPFVPGFALPFLVWPALWRGIIHGREALREKPALFLIAAMLGPFICFCAISGKQLHYLLPLVPSAAVLLAALIDRAFSRAPVTRAGEALGLPILLAVALGVAVYASHGTQLNHSRDQGVVDTVQHLHALWIGAAIAISAALALLARTRVETQALSIAATVILVGGAVILQLSQTLLPYHDLSPIAAGLQPYRNRPIAYSSKYLGEVTFLAHLPGPIDDVAPDDIPAWFAKHPDGIVLERHDRTNSAAKLGKIVLEVPYRGNQLMSLVTKQ